ncbi:MAG: glycoside hydrolase family 43 protein [Asticcacaulis sp.]
MKRVLTVSALALSLLVSGLVPAFSQVPALEVAQPEKTLTIVRSVSPETTQVPPESERSAYLFTYFKDETHDIYFATSLDGYSFTDVNGGQPIFLGRELAEQKGVRDPHLFRGPDGAFYLAMTDLHIFAKPAGLRETEWERPGEEYGWGNNQNLIFMKSYDLLNWTHSRVPVAKLFPEVGDLGVVWAPQTTWDDQADKLMVYYTTRVKKGQDRLVYAYADDDFTTLTTVPKTLFTYPVEGKSAIDGDITKIGYKYHMFYVAHDQPGHLRQAISDKINEGYVFNPQKIDPETVGTEAPNLWRRHGTDTYVLMYDVFRAKPFNNMGFSETADFVNFKNLGRFNEPDSPMKATNFQSPKHGAIIAITPEEAKRLNDYFGHGNQQ